MNEQKKKNALFRLSKQSVKHRILRSNNMITIERLTLTCFEARKIAGVIKAGKKVTVLCLCEHTAFHETGFLFVIKPL